MRSNSRNRGDSDFWRPAWAARLLCFAKTSPDVLVTIWDARATDERRSETGGPAYSERRPCMVPADSRWMSESEQATRGSGTGHPFRGTDDRGGGTTQLGGRSGDADHRLRASPRFCPRWGTELA